MARKDLTNGVEVSIENEQGITIIPKALLFTTKKLSADTSHVVVIQVPAKNLKDINMSLNNNNALFALPFKKGNQSIKVKRGAYEIIL